MNERDTMEQRVAAWLAGSAGTGRTDYIGDVLERTSRTRQRRAWLFAERWFPVHLISVRRLVPRAAVYAVVATAVVLALLGIALVAGSRPHRLPPPLGVAGNGLIAFGTAGSIEVTPADGSRPRAIVAAASIASLPCWSPDGTRIAYFSRAEPKQPASLVVASADGSDPVVVSAALSGAIPMLDRPPAWSPNGDRLAFTVIHAGADSTPALVVVGADGSGLVQVGSAALEAEDPTWSPDGTRLAFRGQVGGGGAAGVAGLYVVDAGGTNAHRISRVTVDTHSYGDPSAFRAPSWSPDGTRLAFTVTVGSSVRDVFVDRVDGSSEVNVTNTTDDEYSPAWSPDGRLIAFKRGSSVVVVAPDGSGARILGSDDAAYFDESSTATWSPDGTKLLVRAVDRIDVLDVAGGPPLSIPALGEPSTDASWQRIALP